MKQNISQYLIQEFEEKDYQTLFKFQEELAWETEHRKLDQNTVTNTFVFFKKNSGLGYYYVIKLDDQVIGCTMINFGNNLFEQKTVNWIQSVFVRKDHRQKGVFKTLYNYIQSQHEKKQKDLRLFVETENEIAQKVYKSLGMSKADEIFIEKDFYFEKDIQNIDSDLTTEFQLNLFVVQSGDQQINRQNFMQFLNDQNNYYQKKKFNDINNVELEKESLMIEVQQNKTIVGYLLFSIEISDWRNGINIYFYDHYLEINDQDIQSFLKQLQKFCLVEIDLGLKVTVLRFLLKQQQNEKFIQQLQKNDYEIGNYYIYEKVNAQKLKQFYT